MTGEELNRKYCELKGWTLTSGVDYIFHHQPKCNPAFAMPPCKCSGALPPLHLDANLAIAEADRVFTGGWEITRTGKFSGQGFVAHKDPTVKFLGYSIDDDEMEDTLPLALLSLMLKALIAAGGK